MASTKPWYKRPLIAVLGVLIVGVATGLIAAQFGGATETAAPPSSTGNLSATSDSSAGVNGCLGGPDLSTALITAQNEAPLTDDGLAALARTTLRWLLHYPVPDGAEQTLNALTQDPDLADHMLDDLMTKSEELEASGYSEAVVDLTRGGYRLSSTTVEGKAGELAQVDVLVYRTVKRAGQTEEQRLVVRPMYTITPDGHFAYGVQDPEPPGDLPDSAFTPYAEGC